MNPKKKKEKKKRLFFRDYTAETTLFIRRSLISFIIILILISILIINLYNLQVIQHKNYQTKSNDNRIKIVPLLPSRGIIYDRNGIPLALNKTFYKLEIIPEKTINLKKIFSQLRDIIDLNDKDIEDFKKEHKRSHRFISIPLKNSLNEVQVARFAVNQHKFPGLEVKGYQRRYYPYGSILTHVIGYVGKINDKDISKLKKNNLLKNYQSMHNIGKLGIERYYENILHGTIGYAEVEVNSHGKVIRQLHEYTPQAGKDIYLTIDLNLQIKIDKLLNSSKAAAIVTDPRNGEILALVSKPTYGPNLFVNGISNKEYQLLLNNPNKPLINRTTQGVYPPASTVKPFIAIAALTENIISTNSIFFDPGWWQLPNSGKRYRDWKKIGHGRLNVVRAIIESSDTFFYQIAYDMGIDRISYWMHKFGYGQYTGIDLWEENSGLMPTREWKQKRYKKPWYQGDTIPIGIGQGYWTTTPIQMAKVLMTLINNGVVKTPHLLYGIKLDKAILPYEHKDYIQIGNINLVFWKLVKEAMYGVANAPNGTAYKNFLNTPYKAAVKSGTAQVFNYEKYNESQVSKHLRDHKLMIGFAPYHEPTISITIILENGGTGITVGNFVRSIFDYLLINKKNISQVKNTNTLLKED
ncbi:Stage V sporulation protein D [Candidatus Arsenophonus lipoptenae]|uniref:Peptidoglycan D,D-transpeptidase MrdA n=1 Tax=Candidatus Arsenophonus lipoptenae TaxID=634113 RepID=A0A0X9VJG3_9GAMM|nr:peptidoglycan DD-transpeptidase MrdA [Candidatus Arsenophonus lipoptenae]AMA65140.1 Stage V sporulation protein D [Candidatus Arsenophonus lipoptenae]